MHGNAFVCLMGLGIVFTGLAALIGLTKLTSLFVLRAERKSALRAPERKAPPAEAADSFAPVLAAILCAFEAELGSKANYQIQSIQKMN